ncbi:MAG TPA: hypothetical protein VLJ11_17945 [Bryobacteraceae bacterium]|nr:hypothetical protein [Bryobacteraceae bacterium]
MAQAPQPPNLPGTISTVATPGYTLFVPGGVAVDPQNSLYISDTAHNRVLKLNQQTQAVSVVNPSLSSPQEIVLDSNGNLYVAESGSQDVRKIAADGSISTVATGLVSPTGVAFDNATQSLYIADNGDAAHGVNGSIKKVDQNGTVSTFNVPGGVLHPSTVAFANGILYLVDNGAGVVEKINVSTQAVTPIASGVTNPWGVALDAAGDVYFTEYGVSPNIGGRVSMVNASSGTVTVIAGNGSFGYSGDGGPGPNASFKDSVTGVTIGPDGNLYVADGSDNVIRKVTFPASNTGDPGNPPVNTIPGCTVISFSASPNPIYTDGTYGITTVLANVTCAYEIHIGSPNGALFATGIGYSSTLTGNWVTDGMQFYLQQSGNTTSQGTLAAPLTVHLKPGFPGLACVATAFSASPNPIVTNDQYGQTTITAVTNCSFDIRIGAPNGQEFKEGRGYASLPTGKWVTDGMTMYLQPHGDTDAGDTLGVLKLVVQPAPAGCTVNDFSSPDNPIKTKSVRNTIHVHANATCPYDVRIQSPDGGSLLPGKTPNTGLLGSGSGETTMTTGEWVTNGMTFFLQQQGSISSAGTLATFTVNTRLPDQATPNCPITTFNASNNPLIAAGGSGQTSINVNAACSWDVRVNDSAGAVLTSGSGAGSATATNVTNGTLFYLQPHNDTSYVDNLAILSATVAPQTPAGCTALVFTATPVQSDDSFGVSTISADATCPYDIRIDSPDGNLFGTGQGFTSAQTGNWVLFGQKFFLQKRGDTTSAGTLASQSAIVLP